MKDTRKLGDLVSVGKAFLRDFEKLGIKSVEDLKNETADNLYERLCQITGQRQDPCVHDTFRCVIEQAKNPNLPKEKCQWFYWSKVRKDEIG